MSKTVIYQMLPRLWGDGSLNCIDNAFFRHVRSLGVTHIWYTGIIRHASGEAFVKGDPGSPYAICDYYDVNPYLCSSGIPDGPSGREGRIREFSELVTRTHEAGLKVITDFVPNHVAPNYSDPYGGLPLHGYCDFDWTDTLKINYGAADSYGKLTEIVDYWASLGVDGFRCDMVELVPREFFAYLTAEVKRRHPGTIFIGEAYDMNAYSPLLDSGFDLLYDKSGFYDRLFSITRSGDFPDTSELNRCWQIIGPDHARMLNFLENHDEVRLASPAFAGSGSNGFAALAVSALFNDAAFMLYFGQEIGLDASESSNSRTSIFSWNHPERLSALYAFINGGSSLKDDEIAILDTYKALGRLLITKMFSSGNSFDLSYFNRQEPGLFPFLRSDGESTALVTANFQHRPVRADIVIPDSASDYIGKALPSEIEQEVPAMSFDIVRL